MIRYVYITEKGRFLAEKIYSLISSKTAVDSDEVNIISYKEFKADSEYIFSHSTNLVFIMASGIVVRAISTLIRSKFTDPGILVIDEKGNNVISLLGGHIGGANLLTSIIAEKIGANPVITTATDVNGLGALDMICKKLNIPYNNEEKKYRDLFLKVNMSLVEGKDVYLYLDVDFENILEGMLNGFKVVKFKSRDEFLYKISEQVKIEELKTDELKTEEVKTEEVKTKEVKTKEVKTEELKIEELKTEEVKIEKVKTEEDIIEKDKSEIAIVITDKRSVLDVLDDGVYSVVPRLNVLGVGCRRDTSVDVFEMSVKNYLDTVDIDIGSIYKIGSIELKKDEKCILDFANKYNMKTRFFTRDELSEVDDLYVGSDFVKKTVGVGSVCQTSSHLLCNGNILKEKLAKNGVTVSLGKNCGMNIV